MTSSFFYWDLKFLFFKIFYFLIFGCRFLCDMKKFVEKFESKYVNSHIYDTFLQVQCNQVNQRPFANKNQEESNMKHTKNTHNCTSKTTVRSLISDLNRWYGNQWKFSGLVMLGIVLVSVILPGILG